MFDLSYLRMVPGLAVAAPANETELCALLESALDHDGPVAIRFPKGSAATLPEMPVAPTPFGEWEVVSQGEDVLLLAAGKQVEAAAKAAASLSETGISTTVVNARWVKPMDPRLAAWAAHHDLVVTVEDNVRTGGFGAGVLEALAADGLAGKVRTLAIPDRFLRFGNQSKILEELGLDAGSIADTVRRLVAEA